MHWLRIAHISWGNHCRNKAQLYHVRRADSMFPPNQWETALLCNDVSHWLGANPESALYLKVIESRVYSRQVIANNRDQQTSGRLQSNLQIPDTIISTTVLELRLISAKDCWHDKHPFRWEHIKKLYASSVSNQQLKECWAGSKWIIWKFQRNLERYKTISLKNAFGFVVCKMLVTFFYQASVC